MENQDKLFVAAIGISLSLLVLALLIVWPLVRFMWWLSHS